MSVCSSDEYPSVEALGVWTRPAVYTVAIYSINQKQRIPILMGNHDKPHSYWQYSDLYNKAMITTELLEYYSLFPSKIPY